MIKVITYGTYDYLHHGHGLYEIIVGGSELNQRMTRFLMTNIYMTRLRLREKWEVEHLDICC